MPISADILCPTKPLGNSACAAIHPSDPETMRVISQNIGPVGLMSSLAVLSFSIKQYQPGILFLQDCRITAHETSKTSTQFRRLFPQYQFSIRCRTRSRTTPAGNQYKYAAATMLHKLCGQGTELFVEVDKPDQGRLITILVQLVDPKAKAFCATNVNKYTPWVEHHSLSSIMQYFIYFISCTMVKISVWYIVTDSCDSMTLFHGLRNTWCDFIK